MASMREQIARSMRRRMGLPEKPMESPVRYRLEERVIADRDGQLHSVKVKIYPAFWAEGALKLQGRTRPKGPL